MNPSHAALTSTNATNTANNTTAATTTTQPFARTPRSALLTRHGSSTNATTFTSRPHPSPPPFTRRDSPASLVSAPERSHGGGAAVTRQVAASPLYTPSSHPDLYASLLQRDRAPAYDSASSTSSSSIASGPPAHATTHRIPAAAVQGSSLVPRSPPSSRLDGAGNNYSSSSGRSLGIRASPLRRQHTDPELSTMVSATTMTMSSTCTASRVGEEERGLESGGHLNRANAGVVHGSEDTNYSAAPSAAFTLLVGPPPPSGLRDPVTLLQLLPADLLLQPAEPPPTLADVTKERGDMWKDRERRSGGGGGGIASAVTGGQLASSAATSSNIYRRAFALLRCATAPASTLSQSRSWQDHCRSGDAARPHDGAQFHAMLGRVMTDVLHRSQRGAMPPTSAPAHAHLSAHRKSRHATARVADENSVLLCSLAGGLDATQQEEQPQDADVVAEAPVVPLIFFAATVECPPDIRRCFILSRTHAYLCDLDGTVAYCAAIVDVRQIVACAGGYMVWRFMTDAMVLTMRMQNAGEDWRKAAGVPFSTAAATATGGGRSGSASPLSLQRSANTPNTATTTTSTVTTPKETRDEMSDWVFRILSIGDARSMLGGPSTPNTLLDSGDPTAHLATSLREEGLAEERVTAMVFLLNVMCTLRTLPRLLIESMTAGAADSAEATSSPRPRVSGTCAAPRALSQGGHGRAGDQLDRLHVPGDRPARVPLLLEGPVGHQTAVKFIEQHWTTRYDQLPPLLRPRRLNAAAHSTNASGTTSTNISSGGIIGRTACSQASATTPSALEGGRGAQVCYVESSLFFPVIPVLPLEACLAVEDAVAEMTQAMQEAVRVTPAASFSLSPPINAVRSGTGHNSRRTAGDAAAAAATPNMIPLKDLNDAEAQATAKATLSPAAWRILEQLAQHGNEREEGEAGGPLWQDETVPTTPLNTPNTANTRAHSEKESSRSSSTVVEVAQGGGPAAVRGMSANAAMDAAPCTTASSHDKESVSEGSVTIGSATSDRDAKAAAAEVSQGPLHTDATMSIQKEQDQVEMADVPASTVSPCRGNASSTRSADVAGAAAAEFSSSSGPLPLSWDAEVEKGALVTDTPPLILRRATSSQTGGSGTGNSRRSSSNDDDRVQEPRVVPREGKPEDATSNASSKSRLLSATARAVQQARLRRQREDIHKEAGSSASADLSPSHAEAHRVHDAVVCVSSSTAVAAASAQLPHTTAPTAEAFERRIQHRPVQDRLLLRARFIKQLLTPPLRSHGGGGEKWDHTFPRVGHPLEGSALKGLGAVHTDAATRHAVGDAEELVDDLRRQRLIAELMCIQQRESVSAGKTSASSQPDQRPSLQGLRGSSPPPPPAGGIDVEGWRAAALEERMLLNSNNPRTFDVYHTSV